MGNYQYFIFLLFPPLALSLRSVTDLKKRKAENLSVQTERAQPGRKPDDTMEGLQHSSESLRVDEAFHVPRPVCVPSLLRSSCWTWSTGSGEAFIPANGDALVSKVPAEDGGRTGRVL